MMLVGIDLQRISLGALVIALGLLVDDAMITIEAMVTRLERGDEKEQAATFAYASTGFPRLTGTLVTIAGFVPIGFAASAAGEYTFSIFAVVAIALIASWFVAARVRADARRLDSEEAGMAHPEKPGPIMRVFRSFLALAMRARWVTVVATLAVFARRSTACASFRNSSFRRLTGRSSSSICSCRKTRPSTRRRTSRPDWTSC